MDCSPPGSTVHGDSPGKNTGVGFHALLQGIFPTQRLNPGLLHYRWILYCLSHQGSPRILEWVAQQFSRGSSQPRNWTGVSCIAGRFFSSWTTREALFWVSICYLNSRNFFFKQTNNNTVSVLKKMCLTQMPFCSEKTATLSSSLQMLKFILIWSKIIWRQIRRVSFSSVQLSHSVVSDSLWPHRLQNARLPCPSPSPGVYSNSCPWSRWCHPTISSSVFPFSRLQSSPTSGCFQMSQLFNSGGQSISASTSVLPMNTQDWSPLGWDSLERTIRKNIFSAL